MRKNLAYILPVHLMDGSKSKVLNDIIKAKTLQSSVHSSWNMFKTENVNFEIRKQQ